MEGERERVRDGGGARRREIRSERWREGEMEGERAMEGGRDGGRKRES